MERDHLAELEVGLTTVVCVSPETYCHAYAYPVPDPPAAVTTTLGSILGVLPGSWSHLHVVALTVALSAGGVVALAAVDWPERLPALS